MGITYFGSTIKSGSDSLTENVDGGFVVVSQTITLTTNSSAAVDGSVNLPAGSQILGISLEKSVDRSAGTATTLPVTVGNVAGGTQYLTSVDMFSTAQSNGTPSVANMLARGNIGSTTLVSARVAPNGTITGTQAVVRVVVTYAQKQ